MPHMAAAGLEPCQVYTLGSVGEQVLALTWEKTRKELNYTRRYAVGRGAPLIMHDLMVAEFFVRANEQVGQMPDCDMQWGNERMAAIYDKPRTKSKPPEELVRPDGWWLLRQKGKVHYFFLEMDRGNTRWPKKANSYEKAYQRMVALGKDSFATVLNVVPHNQQGRVVSWLTDGRRQVRHLVLEWPDLLTSGPFTDWYDVQTGHMVNLLDVF